MVEIRETNVMNGVASYANSIQLQSSILTSTRRLSLMRPIPVRLSTAVSSTHCAVRQLRGLQS